MCRVQGLHIEIEQLSHDYSLEGVRKLNDKTCSDTVIIVSSIFANQYIPMRKANYYKMWLSQELDSLQENLLFQTNYERLPENLIQVTFVNSANLINLLTSYKFTKANNLRKLIIKLNFTNLCYLKRVTTFENAGVQN